MKRIFNGLLVVSALGLAACGNNQIVKKVDLAASTADSRVKVSVAADLNTDKITLSPMSLQFFNPKDPMQLFAGIDVSSPEPSVTKVGFTFDFTQLLSFVVIGETTSLPNGTPIPVTGANPTWMVLQPKGVSNHLVYLNVNTDLNRAAVGYTLASDAVKSGALGNLIVKFDLTGLGGKGAGGIYNGAAPGTSGFALFADISTVFGVGATSDMQLIDETPNEVKLQIQRLMYELNERRARIQFN